MADDKRYMGFWIGHLREEEQSRIQARQHNPHEREMLAKGEDLWAKFRGPVNGLLDQEVNVTEPRAVASGIRAQLVQKREYQYQPSHVESLTRSRFCNISQVLLRLYGMRFCNAYDSPRVQ